MWVFRFAQKQTRLRNVDTDYCLLVEGSLHISWYLQAFEDSSGNTESMYYGYISPFLEIHLTLARWYDSVLGISKRQVLFPVCFGFQLMFCFHPAHPMSLVKGLDFTYRNGYPSCKVIYLGKSPKKKIHVLIHQFYSDYLRGLKPQLTVAAAEQSRFLGVIGYRWCL